MIYTPENYIKEQTWIDTHTGEILDKDIIIPEGCLPSKDTKIHLNQWREKGFVLFKNVIDKTLIYSLCEELELLRKDPQKLNLSVELQGRQTRSIEINPGDIDREGTKINHLHVSSGNAARLGLSAAITSFLGSVFRSPPIPMQSLTFIRGSQQPTHIDYPYVRRQKRIPFMAASWIPLEPVSADAGPLAYFPGAHKPEISGFFDWGNGDILSRPETQTKDGMEFARFLDKNINERSIPPVLLLPQPGDVLIWHCNLPHQGTKIKDKTLTRRSLVTHYTGLNDYPKPWFRYKSDDELLIYREHGGALMDFPWNDEKSKLPSWSQLNI